jgi:hypothetical protein
MTFADACLVLMEEQHLSRAGTMLAPHPPRPDPGMSMKGGREGGSYRYLSLEAPDVRAAAAGDPRGFLELNPP